MAGRCRPSAFEALNEFSFTTFPLPKGRRDGGGHLVHTVYLAGRGLDTAGFPNARRSDGYCPVVGGNSNRPVPANTVRQSGAPGFGLWLCAAVRHWAG